MTGARTSLGLAIARGVIAAAALAACGQRTGKQGAAPSPPAAGVSANEQAAGQSSGTPAPKPNAGPRLPVSLPPATSTVLSSNGVFAPGGLTLTEGQAVAFGNVSLTMQADGNLILASNGQIVWVSATNGQCAHCQAAYQKDGNLVLTNKDTQKILYTSATGGSTQLALKAVAPFMTMTNATAIVWAATPVLPGFVLRLGQVLAVPSSDLALVMQTDGDLVLWSRFGQSTGAALWSTETPRSGCTAASCYGTFQADGNLVLYQDGAPYWASNTGGQKNGGQIILSERAPFITIQAGGAQLWPRLNDQISTATCAAAAPAAGAAAAAVAALDWPKDHQVVQRGGTDAALNRATPTTGWVLVKGSVPAGKADCVDVAFTHHAGDGSNGTDIAWHKGGDVDATGHFSFYTFAVQGGWYTFGVRPALKGVPGPVTNVAAVGVGEVFVTAGQSNATNFGELLATDPIPQIKLTATTDLASHATSMDASIWIQPVRNAVLGTADGFSNCVNPTAAPADCTHSSPWPLFAAQLSAMLHLPVAIVATGYGGQGIAAWLPGAAPPSSVRLAPLPLRDYLGVALKNLGLLGGARAVLWVQGEADAGGPATADAAKLKTTYASELDSVITDIRSHYLDTPWVVSQTAFVPGAAATNVNAVVAAQASLWSQDKAIYPGPATYVWTNGATDLVEGKCAAPAKDDYRDMCHGNGPHFNAVIGLQTHAGAWFQAVINRTAYGQLVPPGL